MRILGIAGAIALSGRAALAAPGDGVYGRLAGDLQIEGGIGGGFAGDRAVGIARVGATFVQAAGLHFVATDSMSSTAPFGTRTLSPGIHLSPLFWARFASDLQSGNARLDLFIDSLSLECGAVWTWDRDRFVPDPGLSLGVSLGFPIFADASGPFVTARASVRYSAADLAGDSGAIGPIGLFGITIAWHQVVGAHFVDAGDRAVR